MAAAAGRSGATADPQPSGEGCARYAAASLLAIAFAIPFGVRVLVHRETGRWTSRAQAFYHAHLELFLGNACLGKHLELFLRNPLPRLFFLFPSLSLLLSSLHPASPAPPVLPGLALCHMATSSYIGAQLDWEGPFN
ncbi:Putative G-protein coupled receptor [Gryllus bimaculatus]|nr:Putative G-protein coupled receptor [Gryllus bimaculatus]